MDINRLCCGCFHTLPENARICPRCGFDPYEYETRRIPEALAPNTILRGTYLVGKVLGKGGFGITYIGYHLALNAVVAIKELFPTGVVLRDTKNNPTALTNPTVSLAGASMRAPYEKTLQDFMEEARTVWKIDLSQVVEVTDCFEENGTAYMVMKYIAGKSMKECLKESLKGKGNPLAEREVLDLLQPVIRSLGELHNKGIMHRDISPDNLMLGEDGKVILVDFGAARSMVSSMGGAGRSLTVVLKPGYAPIEQYNSRGNQGPWTDIYALCSTMYKLLTGITPEEASIRLGNADDRKAILDNLRKNNVSEKTSKALLKGMEPLARDRWQSIGELEAALYGSKSRKNSERPVVKKRAETKETRMAGTASGNKTPGKKGLKWLILLLVLVAASTITGVLIHNNNRKKEEQIIAKRKESEAQAQRESIEASEAESQQESIKVSEAESQRESVEASEAESQEESNKASEAESQRESIEASEAESQQESIEASEAESQQESIEASEAESQADIGAETVETEALAAEALGYKVGDTLTFGTYEQDNDRSNGSEPIEWLVLDIEDGKAFLLSKYGLDALLYSEVWGDITWETCDLRAWLNTVFYQEAFPEQERKLIDYSTVIAEDNEQYGSDAGNDTQDKIYLLSASEASRYFKNDDSRKCYPTEYAKVRGAYVENGLCGWYLRMPGHTNHKVTYVRRWGWIDFDGNKINRSGLCVRPAMWVNLSQ